MRGEVADASLAVEPCRCGVGALDWLEIIRLFDGTYYTWHCVGCRAPAKVTHVEIWLGDDPFQQPKWLELSWEEFLEHQAAARVLHSPAG